MKIVEIEACNANQRLDKFLFKYFNKAGKSFIYKMLRKKRIKYNGAKAEGNEILKQGDCLQMYLSSETMNSFMEAKALKKTEIKFSVIYEDENIIICEKPAGVIVQGDNENNGKSLNDQLLYYLYQRGEYNPVKESVFTPSICNRLDRNTSGIVLFGKNFAAVQNLNEILKNNGVIKFYLTVVKGKIDKAGVFKGWHVKRDGNKAEIYDEFREGSKEIITEYCPLKYSKGYTLLEVKLVTGRTHQIRAGFEHSGYYIVGDRKYGDLETNKFFKEKYGLESQFLHAYKVIFKQNSGVLNYLDGRKFVAPLNESMKKIVSDFFCVNMEVFF